MPAPLSAHDNPEAYIAGDRRRALAAGRALPDRVHGAALFADISGFTPLTEALVAEHGAQRGAEELSLILDGLFNAVLVQLHRHGGSVVYFSGDAVTCWLDGDDGLLATSCALAMQETMATAGVIRLPSGRVIRLAMKIAIAVGRARRFVVGDHLVQLIDVLAGALMDDLAAAERQAVPGEIILDQSVFTEADPSVEGHLLTPGGADQSHSATAVDGDIRRAGGRTYLQVRRLVGPVTLPAPDDDTDPLPEAVVRQWLLPAVYERLRTGRGEFLAELRTAVPLFLRFGGLDYDADPDAGAKLDRFVIAAQRIIDGYGGSTLQLTLGDKGAYLYGVFGTPLAHEDDAARACAAALELLTLEAEHAVSGLQIGLGHGRVRSGTYGHAQRRTFCCLGDAVNLAARLMTAAPPGRIFASAAVHRAAGPGFEWSRLDDQRVKGKALAVEAYELTGADRRGSTSRHRRHTLPMIGRDEQLAELSRHIVAACDGKGQVVLVSAPAGLGKSRLLVEGARLLRDRDVRAHEGEAQAFGPPTSYTVWHDIWRGVLGVAESRDGASRSAEEHRDQLRRRVGALDPSLLPRLPLLGAALGLAIEDNELTASLTPKLRKASLESLLISLVERLTEGGEPLVLMLEDCQWLDPLSADLLHELARSVVDLPVLLLLAYRPSETDPADESTRADETPVAGAAQPDPVEALRPLSHFHEIVLGELDAAACRDIVLAKLAQLGDLAPSDDGTEPRDHDEPRDDDVPEALVTMVLERADGNPFYLEELVTFIHSRGIDPADPAALKEMALPDSLHSLVLSRIDTMAEGPRRTAKVASVIGRFFRTPMLLGVYPELGSADEVAAHLAALRRIGLVMLETTVAESGEQAHLFKHMITAQAAYESTPAVMREGLHERVGTYLERLEGDRVPGARRDGTERSGMQLDLLAYHFGRSANLGKKRDYLLRAGDRARTDYANAAAIDYYTRAAPLVSDDQRAEVLRSLGAVLELTGAWGHAERTYAEALALAERLDHAAEAHRSRKALAEVARKQGRYDESAALLRTARDGFTALGDATGVGEVLHLAGTLAAQQGDLEQAGEHYRASLEIRQTLGDIDGMAGLFSNLGVIAEYAGDYDAAKELNLRSLALRLEVGNRWAVGVSQNNLGMIALLQHDYAEAVARFTEAMRLNTEVGDLWMVAIAHNNLGNATREQGQLEASAHHLGQALAAYRRYEDRWALAIVYEDIAALAARRGDAEPALTLAGAADTLREQIGSPRSEAQQAGLDEALAAATAELGERSTDLIAAGRALEAEAAAVLAERICRPAKPATPQAGPRAAAEPVPPTLSPLHPAQPSGKGST